MADEENASDIVEELVTYLAASDAAIREEMVLKIAILSEKFTDDLNWYVSLILPLRFVILRQSDLSTRSQTGSFCLVHPGRAIRSINQ